MKNRLLIFVASTFVIGILFSFSMLCFASLQNSEVSSKAGYCVSHSLTEKSSGKKKVSKEFNKSQTTYTKNTVKVKSNFVNAVFDFNSSIYNSFYESKTLICGSSDVPVSSLEEIRSVRLII